jgi:hypothetical protein
MEGIIFCRKCGQKNQENNHKCTQCGFELHAPAPPQYVVTDDNTMGGLIPYKNAPALWAYYLGIFSLIPIVGLPLGLAALVLGIKGEAKARQHPETQGKVHAWVGIVLGGVCALGNILLVLMPVWMGLFN